MNGQPAVLRVPDARSMPMWPDFEVPSVYLDDVDIDAVTVRRAPIADFADLQPRMSRAVWRPAPGRKVGFYVEHAGTLVGLLFLASPVINLAVRDEYLRLPSDPSAKGGALRSYMDLSVCVSAQPVGWYWNLGKMLAMLATTLAPDLDYPEPLVGLTTTSLYGHGSQYNRLWKFLGYTKGYGHEHVSDVRYRAMMRHLWESGEGIPSSAFGTGSNPRMRRIMAYRKSSGDETASVFHGHKRGVYYSPAADKDRRAVLAGWYSRWGKPRYDRVRNDSPPYMDGVTEATA